MKTTEINNGAVDNKANGTSSTGKAGSGIRPNLSFQEAAATEKQEKKDEVKAADPHEGKGAVKAAPEAEQKKPEPNKAELKAKLAAEKPAMNLESTLELIEDLSRKKRQRENLLRTTTNLAAFEVELKEDVDETDGNYYQGAQLSIKDDNGNAFATKNPVIIKAVADFVKDICADKLAEIEAGIVLPA